MASDQSDIEMDADSQKKAKKMPIGPAKDLTEKQDTKKLSTKEMILKALSESKSRKGISLYAIKKYIYEKFSVDIEKINYLIKKNIKESVEAGIIIQTKGIGASGSFRLAPTTKRTEMKTKKSVKRPKKPKIVTEKEEETEKPKKSRVKNAEDGKNTKKVATISKNAKEKMQESKKSKLSSIKENPKAGTSVKNTPKKKSNMMKRKSIGSIIKPPRMRPAKAK